MPVTVGSGRQAIFAPLDGGAGRPEAIVRRLGSAIALGLIADGEQLPAESELATALGVAPVTLREALSDLRRRGLLQTRRGRGGGSFVTVSETALAELARRRVQELGTTDLRELGEFHAAVAGTAARLAAERASVDEIARLRATVGRLAGSVPAAVGHRIQGRFYIEVAAAAQSVRLTRQEIELQSELAELQLFPADGSNWAAMAVTRHTAVVDAIAQRAGSAARRLTEDFIAERTLGMIEAHMSLTAGSGDAGDDAAARDDLEANGGHAR